MSFAIALENNSQTVFNLEAILNILKNYSPTTIPQDYTQEQIDNLVEWLNNIYKLLTDYTLFAES